METPVHEYVCADCKAQVFSYGGPEDRTRCAECEIVFELKEEGKLTPGSEASLRELLGCQIPKEDETT